MTLVRVWTDKNGTSAIEFALTAPAFFLVLFAAIEGGLLLWTQLGMQHGVELAARCASVNTTLCNDAAAIKSYAAQQAYGLTIPASDFSVSTQACGNQVTASYTYNLVTNVFGLPSITLSAKSCFPS